MITPIKYSIPMSAMEINARISETQNLNNRPMIVSMRSTQVITPEPKI